MISRKYYCQYLVLCAVVLCVACSEISHNKGISSSVDGHKKGFVKATVPDSLTDGRKRATYLASHYWDGFNFGDTAYIHSPEITEQAFCDYLPVLLQCDSLQVASSVAGVLDHARSNDPTGKVYTYFAELFEKYLYDPNSPFRNEELYIPVARYILGDSLLEFTECERFRFKLEMMLKNRLGQKATDFSYYKLSGTKGTLYENQSQYTLLLFYEPGCPACRETISLLKGSDMIGKLIDNRRLCILSVYAGTDLDAYRKHRSELPENWIDSYDRDGHINIRRLYDLKATPTIYLLDIGKRVLLKDTDVATVERFLAEKVVRGG